ncbi:transcriptional regulator [Synergistales bacterium]|nr:transcriptional regulator [Synergistales bacterium]
MTKAELVNSVAEAVEALLTSIKESLVKGEKVQIVGFGSFGVRERAARKGRNPQDPQKVINIPAKKVPFFHAGKALKEAVSAQKKMNSFYAPPIYLRGSV